MAYSRVIKYYDADDVLLGTITNCTDCKFSLLLIGGCGSGSLELTGTVQDDYLLSVGYIVRCYHDGSILEYTGIVQGRKNKFSGSTHEYQLQGFYSQLASVQFSEKLTYTAQTCGEIVSDLLENFISTQTDIDDDDSLIDSDVEVSEYLIESGADLINVLTELQKIASSGSDKVFFGVDASKKLYFMPLSEDAGDYQGTLTVGTDIQDAEEIESEPQARNQIVIRSSTPSRSTGFHYKKTYTHSDGRTLGRPLVIKSPGLHKEADFDLLSQGWFNLYNNSSIILQSANHYFLLENSTPAKPWLGMFNYIDSSRSINQALPASSIEVDFNEPYRLTVKLGLSGDDPSDSDRMAPVHLEENFLNNINSYTDDIAQPDLTDLTFPADVQDYPRMINDEIFGDMLEAAGGGGGGGSGTGLARYDVVEFFHSPTIDHLNTTDYLRMSVVISQGDGGALTTEDIPFPVRFNYRFKPDSGSVQAVGAINAVLKSTDGNLELWQTDNSTVTFSVPGRVYVSVEITTDDDPLTLKYYPLDLNEEDYNESFYSRVINTTAPTQPTIYINYSFLNLEGT